jgi:hypothetical protein
MKRPLAGLIVWSIVVSLASPSGATVLLLTFEGLQDGESVDNFYSGGTGGLGSGPGPDHGVSLSNARASVDSDAGGSGSFGGEPSPNTVIAPEGGGGITVDVPDGFTSDLSFFYSSPDGPLSVDIYDGLGGTGNLLFSHVVPTSQSNGAPDPSGTFSPFFPTGATFGGVARSFDVFSPLQKPFVVDDIAIGSDTPARFSSAPEPISFVVWGGLACLASAASFRRLR